MTIVLIFASLFSAMCMAEFILAAKDYKKSDKDQIR